ncbi:hypothetical protein [Maribellus mangrovi]
MQSYSQVLPDASVLLPNFREDGKWVKLPIGLDLGESMIVVKKLKCFL